MKVALKSLVMGLVFCFASEAWAELARVQLNLADGQTVESVIIDLYKSEVAKAGSPLALEVERIQTEEVEDLGQIFEPTERDMLMISSGRGGYGHYGRTYLLGVPVLWNGTGMIEEYIEYIQVYVNLTIGEGDGGGELVTVTFEKMVQISL